MNPLSEVHDNEKRKQDSFNEFINGEVAQQTESSIGLVEAESVNPVGSHFDAFQLKLQPCADLAARMDSEMMKVNSLENASTHSLFTVMSKILDESIEKKNGDIPQRVASLLKLVMQEIEHRNSQQAQVLKKQNNLYKFREQKYRSRLRALETLAAGTTEENEVIMSQLHQLKIEKIKIEEQKKHGEHELFRLMKEKDHNDNEISSLKQELDLVIKNYEERCLQLEMQASETKVELEKKITELESLLNDSRKKVDELEECSETKYLKWKRKELGYKHFMDNLFGSVQELRIASKSIKQEVLRTKKIYSEEFNHFGLKLKGLIDAAQNYHTVLEENRKLYNEVQDLKGNIRVYCRIRPFLHGQNQKETAIEYIGENGELVVVHPSKQGKDSHRLFKFNKVFGPTASQEEVFLDTQPLIRSVLDGYNVCIFAYGQTGSGKTYTMAGPSMSSVISVVDWGVNYRALNDLFHISQGRKSSIAYEVGVQMVEIYNEQVRDLLSINSSQKRLGIWSTTQPNGLAVPDASMHSVKSIADVLELMNVGLMNRAVGATALNERSSRSHSILTVHVRGTDLKTNAVLRGCLHLVDLAGSERVDRSEATGDRLREAQHINKSLSALGDVIFALAQKSSHVPYRNSKLTQVLQSSLGGQAKTLMFVQLNPDVESYFETISTLKFAERVSGVELGAARSNKEGRGVRELMEQMASLKDTIAKKDEEIGQIRLFKTNVNGDKHSMSSPRYDFSSTRRYSLGMPGQSQTPSVEKSSRFAEKAASDLDDSSEYSDKNSEGGSPRSTDGFRNHREFFQQTTLVADVQNPTVNVESEITIAGGGQNISGNIRIMGLRDVDSEERLSDISDGVLSMGTETDGSMNGIAEFSLFPGSAKAQAGCIGKSTVPVKLPRPPPQKQVQMGSSQLKLNKTSARVSSSSKKATAGSSSANISTKRLP